MEKELYDIPIQARLCYEKNKGLILPDKVPYIGMGSSYFAAVVLRYAGVKIFPEVAGEYFNYIRVVRQFESAVLISQSGRTTDVINCSTCFREFIAVVNNMESGLIRQSNLKSAIPIYAGSEQFSSTKTFINTLVVLYLGHGFDVRKALDSIEGRFAEYELIGQTIGSSIDNSLKKRKVKCINIIGSGPNVGIAHQAALVLSESTKIPFYGMSITQYEHGYKETATDSIVIVINPQKGVLFKRTQKMMDLLRNSGATVFEISEPELDEILSPFTSILPFYFMASFLQKKMGIQVPFLVGNKITERAEG
jgi:glucosamine--fructose-6-phosphate aminotransferase (isomerizing)